MSVECIVNVGGPSSLQDSMYSCITNNGMQLYAARMVWFDGTKPEWTRHRQGPEHTV
jgi:hypothetical protein